MNFNNTIEKVSIIIPMYNAEDNIEKCLQSIINQEYSNIEILIINDGSTDSSIEIVNKYIEYDSRIIIINQKNEGRSSARNAGISASSGKYIMFVDSDDWVELEMIKEMVRMVENNKLDIAMSTIRYITDFKTYIRKFPWDNNKIFEGDEIINEFYPHLLTSINYKGDTIEEISGSVCRAIYLSSIIKENSIVFDNHIAIGEDKLFNLEYILHANKILITNKAYYNYRRLTADGGSTTQNYMKNYYEMVKYRQLQYKNLFKDKSKITSMEYLIEFDWLKTTLGSINNLLLDGFNGDIIDLFREVRKIINDSEIKEISRNYNVKQLKDIGLIDIKLIWYCYPLFILKKKIIINLKKGINKFRKNYL